MIRPLVNSAPETCAYCKGRGWVFVIPCRVCNGQGSVLVAQPARKCSRCQGSGIGVFLRCKGCSGTGWAHAMLPEYER